jgi:hypothetical protein
MLVRPMLGWVRLGLFRIGEVRLSCNHRCTQGVGGVVEKGEEGGTSCNPSKDFEKLDHKNAIKHENRGHPPSHNPKYPLRKNLKMTEHLQYVSNISLYHPNYPNFSQMLNPELHPWPGLESTR